MGILSKKRYKRMAVVICFLILIYVWMFYKSTDINFNSFYLNITYNNEIESKENYDLLEDFLVFSSKCHILKYDVFSDEISQFYEPKEYIACSRQPLLSYLTKSDNKTAVVLHIDEDSIPAYSKNGVSCCYSIVTRWSDLDYTIGASNCKNFTNNIALTDDTFVVHCEDLKTKEEVYANAHTSILMTNAIQKKLKQHQSNSVLSVLMVGIDSISRLNLIRMMPQTYLYLKEKNWIEYRGYNKMGDNTFPNLMAIFTGKNESFALRTCNPLEIGSLDNCSSIFFNYSAGGYVTAYAEDKTVNITPFRFEDLAIDYYLRPNVKAAEQLKVLNRDKNMDHCLGPESYGERLLNLAKDFAVTFKNQPNFGLFWMNSFSHNDLNAPSMMDFKVRAFLRDITTEGVLNNTLVVFLSDHGLRFGEIRYTRTGWLEERLPYIFFSVPKWFQEHHPREYTNLVNNANKLTSPYDVYMTLQDILAISGANYTAQPASGCPTCKSLFEEVENERSCEEAGISQHWCTCDGYKRIETTEEIVTAGAWSVIYKIEAIRLKNWKKMRKCKHFYLMKVLSSEISDNSVLPYRNNSFLKVVFETAPYAVFEATLEVIQRPVSADVVLISREFVVQDEISRLNDYLHHARCVKKVNLKLYCHCHRF